jgi:hypothetical protein
MLWLIWIAIMLLTPILAGVGVWYQTRAQPHQAMVAEAPIERHAAIRAELVEGQAISAFE